jgi:alanine racemase
VYTASQLASLFPEGKHLLPSPDATIQHICIDSRKAAWQPNAIFLALQGARIDGHRYIQDAWNQGVRNFLIKDDVSTSSFPEGNYIRVPNVIDGFQTLAAFHRDQYQGHVIVITGSNGKTWVKEWLYMVLYQHYSVYRSPGSYNSQVGVPLSMWNLPLDSSYAIFEAGISSVGEMEKLERIIRPDTVVFTHLGDAHDEGFGDDHALKVREKLMLASNAETIVFPADEKIVADHINTVFSTKRRVTWSLAGRGDINITYRSGDQVSQRASEQMSKRANEQTSERANEQVSELESEKLIKAKHDSPSVGERSRTIEGLGVKEEPSSNSSSPLTNLGAMTVITATDKIEEKHFTIPFTGLIPVINSAACYTTMHALGLTSDEVMESFEELRPIDMRLKAEDGIQGCVLINDSYSLDLDSLQYALESLDIAGSTQKKTLIVSDHAHGRLRIYQDLARMIAGAGVDKLICIGQEIASLINLMPETIECIAYSDVEELFRKGEMANFQGEVILLKGARRFGFERIARQLRLRSHSAVLHVDFGALDNNLRYFYKQIKPGVKKIAVVKANAYGAGSLEVCRFLSYQHLDMLAVAVIDEGIELRDAGISIPVIVLNPDPEGMDLIVKHHLEPEIYNAHILRKLLVQCKFSQEQAVIHIKLDSGTHRLGFCPEDIGELIAVLKDQPWIKVGTVFTHLSGSDDPKWDDFTHEQARRFDRMYETLVKGINYNPPRHILSTSGILRFPQYQYECVRMGIGLYGVGFDQHPQLIPVHALKARILHIQEVQRGESVSYSRSFISDKERRIATVNIGYADGLPRVAGNVGCSLRLHGKNAPITGRVCMDMTMIDVTDIPEANIGDEVIIFDKDHSIEVLAKACNTIAYEIMTNLNPRVRKVYEHGS